MGKDKNEKMYETYYRGDGILYTISKNMVTGIWYFRDGEGKVIAKGDALKVQAAKHKFMEGK